MTTERVDFFDMTGWGCSNSGRYPMSQPNDAAVGSHSEHICLRRYAEFMELLIEIDGVLVF